MLLGGTCDIRSLSQGYSPEGATVCVMLFGGRGCLERVLLVEITHKIQIFAVLHSDVNKDWTHKDKDRTHKDKDEDLKLVLRSP